MHVCHVLLGSCGPFSYPILADSAFGGGEFQVDASSDPTAPVVLALGVQIMVAAVRTAKTACTGCHSLGRGKGLVP